VVKPPEDSYFDTYLSALISDIKKQIDFFNVKEIPTVYIGGGTPSVLGKKIKILFDTLKEFPCFKPVEFTVEANPESLTEGFLETCLEGGVNRLSLGVQTFHEPSRLAVNRKGGKELLEERLVMASRYFSGGELTLSADLITGLPYSSEETVIDDINRILEFAPDHVSLYSLSVENGTRLKENVKTNVVELPSIDCADNFWLLGKDLLLKTGFEHYEISNFAKPGKDCLHNMRYWQMENWLGAGPAASGTIVCEKTASAKRYTTVSDVEKYVSTNNGQLVIDEEPDKIMFLKECILMGYRCKAGPDPVLFKRRFGCAVEECIPKTLAKWEGKDKMLFLNSFLTEAFDEIQSESSS